MSALRVPDTGDAFATGGTCRAVDGPGDRGASTRRVRRFAMTKGERASALAEWHGLLLEYLVDAEGGLLDQIAGDAALGPGTQVLSPCCSRIDAVTRRHRCCPRSDVVSAVESAVRHEFWSDKVSFAVVQLGGVIGRRQVTDAYSCSTRPPS